MSDPDHDELTRQSFRRQVPLFAGPDSVFASERPEALAWLEPLRSGMAVLETACGAAHLAQAVAPFAHQVVGLDLTPELLALGRQRLDSAGIGNVVLQAGNAEDMPFVDRSFDLVFCRSSLHHFANPPAAVAEMVRVCRGGGRVVLSDLVAPTPEVRELFDHVHRLLDPSHVRVCLESELAGLFPPGLSVSSGPDRAGRLPLDTILTEQSADGEIGAMLREELRGGPATGFEPREENGQLTIAFLVCAVEVNLPHPD